MSIEQVKTDALIDRLTEQVQTPGMQVALSVDETRLLLDYINELEGAVSSLEDEVSDLESALYEAQANL
jgi:hypothetical protein